MHHKSSRASEASVICIAKLRAAAKCRLVNSQMGAASMCTELSEGVCVRVRAYVCVDGEKLQQSKMSAEC